MLVEKLREKHLSALTFLEILNKMSDVDFFAFTHFLFNKNVENASKKIKKRIEEMEENGRKYLKVMRKGNEITIELPEL